MIPRTIPAWQIKSWQDELSQLITEPSELFSLLDLDPMLLANAERAHRLFPLRTTRAYANRIKKATPDDPLLRQILPLGEEIIESAGFSNDPLQERDASPVTGLIHKYSGRVLLIAASQCAINCRYCFRRHFDYQANSPSRSQWQPALNYIANESSIDEVILSGGDPLAISDKQLAWLLEQIAEVPHVTKVRIHTRIPIVVPSRITNELINILCSTRLSPVMVIHCNHPQEIDDTVSNALVRLKGRLPLLNQTVLLRGVNDCSQTLSVLSHTLFARGVLPYYLHLLDRVNGASHFEVNEEEAKRLHQSLVDSMSGYLVPKLVKEVPNAASKIAIN